MPYRRQIIVSRDVAVLGRVIVAGGRAERLGVLGAHGVRVMGQSSRLFIGTTVSLRLRLWLGVSRPLAGRKLRGLPVGRP